MQNVPLDPLKISSDMALRSLDLRGSMRPSGFKLRNRSIREPADDEVVVEDIYQMDRLTDLCRDKRVKQGRDYGMKNRENGAHDDNNQSNDKVNSNEKNKDAAEQNQMKVGGQLGARRVQYLANTPRQKQNIKLKVIREVDSTKDRMSAATNLSQLRMPLAVTTSRGYSEMQPQNKEKRSSADRQEEVQFEYSFSKEKHNEQPTVVATD